MTTYHDDLIELRQQFAVVDKKDPKALRQWFDTHSYLSTNDFAQIGDCSARKIRQLKKLAGIVGKMPANLPISKAQSRVVTLTAPADWDNYEWFSKVAKSHTYRDLSTATGLSYRSIYTRLKRWGLKTRGQVSHNPCHTKEWCEEHYVKQGLSQTKCAKLAKVGQQTFANWLNDFKIPVRTARETSKAHTNVKLWVRKLFHALEQQDTIRSVRLRHDHIHVRYMNYFWETYYLKDKTDNRVTHSRLISNKENGRLEHIPEVTYEYESDLVGGQQFPAHLIINPKEWKQSSLIEQRVALHEFCRRITQRDWIWPEYPEFVLQEEWRKVQDYKESKYMSQGAFTAYADIGKNPTPGRRIIEHFMDLSNYAAAFKSPRYIMKLLNSITKRKLTINTHNLLRTFSCSGITLPSQGKTFRIIDPGLYAVILKRLNITGTVFDLNPGLGNRAIACAILGLKYTTIPDERFQQALDKGLATFLGLDYEPYDGQKVDLLIHDRDFTESKVEDALPYATTAKQMAVFVPVHLRKKTLAKHSPTSTLKIQTRTVSKISDYLFLY